MSEFKVYILSDNISFFSMSILSIGIIIFLCLLLIGLFLLYLAQTRKNDKYRDLPHYRIKRAYMTAPEIAAYKTIKEVLPQGTEVFPQAALAAVLDKLTGTSYRNELFRIVDFIITDTVQYKPLLLIEINDASHMRADRAERDRKVKAICDRASMPIISFTLNELNDARLMRRRILSEMLRA